MADRPRQGLVLASLAAVAALPLLAACTDNSSSADPAGQPDPRRLTVKATDTACTLSATTAPSGRLTFSVTNGGSTVTEFYLLQQDGKTIVGEMENIGPGLSRDLVVTAATGSYVTACKPGMVGDGIRAAFTVTASDAEPTNADQELIAQATEEYEDYVRAQTDHLVAATREFTAAYKSGRHAQARHLYPRARVYWERIEPVAESFGDIDPKLDLREADLEAGQAWTGWHRIEKDLWPARAHGYQQLSAAGRATYADDLTSTTKVLYDKAQKLTITSDQISNGARELMDEVATGKVTGEEEYWSRTDLWDFQANVDGARAGFEALRPVLTQRDPELEAAIAGRFDALQKLLDGHRVGDGFQTYDALSKEQVKTLSDAVNALSEPLSKLTAAVV